MKRKLVLVLAFLFVPACDDASSNGGNGNSITCSGLTAPANDSTVTFDFGGVSRSFIVHMPPAYAPTQRSPLVLSMHGYMEPADLQPMISGMNPKADAAGYIVVYPSGTGNPVSWNAGTCCPQASL